MTASWVKIYLSFKLNHGIKIAHPLDSYFHTCPLLPLPQCEDLKLLLVTDQSH